MDNIVINVTESVEDVTIEVAEIKITGLGDAATKNVGTGSGDVAAGNDSRFPTTDEKAALAGTGTPSSSNKFVTADDIPVKASDSEIDTGTDDAKFATAKAIADSDRGRKITYGTADPTGTPSDGDIYMQYED